MQVSEICSLQYRLSIQIFMFVIVFSNSILVLEVFDAEKYIPHGMEDDNGLNNVKGVS